MQDRIIGPLTMIQFIEAVIGGGLAYVCIASIPGFFGKFLGIIFGLLTVAIVLVKINERPFIHFLLSLIQFIKNPKQRSWHRGAESSLNIEIIKSAPKKKSALATKHVDKSQIEDLARKVDSEGYKNIKT